MLSNSNRTELIYDDTCFDHAQNIRFQINHPERKEIVLEFDRPWEGFASTYHSILFDKETSLYYLYYRGMPTDNDSDMSVSTCVAVSEDGIHFVRPELGIYEKNGSKRNNIILSGDAKLCHNFAPFLDTNPDCPKEERFKAVAGQYPEGLFVFCGGDGYHFHKYSEAAVITNGAFDSLNTAFFDTVNQVYRCYSRYFDQGSFSGYRSIQSYVSQDMIHWTDPVPNRYPDRPELRQHLYTNSTRPVPGSEHILVSIPMRFQPERKKVSRHPEAGVSDCILMFSRNGNDWKIPFVQPWIYPGLDEKAWTQRNFIVSAGIAETGDELSFYIDEHYMWEDNRLVRYTIPLGRFASAYSEDGLLITKPFVPDTDTIGLNYMTSAYGTLTVCVLDENGRCLPEETKEIYGNELRKTVTFSGICGRKIRLSFRLQDAFLFAVTGLTL